MALTRATKQKRLDSLDAQITEARDAFEKHTRSATAAEKRAERLKAERDYGTHYADQLIQLIEARNCIQGCTHAGTLAAVREHGPGGTCHLLALVGLPERVKGFEHDGGVTTIEQPDDAPGSRWGVIPADSRAPLCTERTPRPAPVRRGPRKRQAVLFEVTA